MDYEAFENERKGLEDAPVRQRKAFYEAVLQEELAPTRVRMLAYFNYALLFYHEGDFQKVRETLEPLIFNYQSYAYSPQMISCFNLMAVAAHCEGKYALARYFSEYGLKLAQEHDEKSRFSYEYNNVALTYMAEHDYENALRAILLAEQHLPESDEQMGAYVYLNLAIIYRSMGQLDKAEETFLRSVQEFRAENVLPDDVLSCGTTLYYKRGEMEKYRQYRERLLDRLEEMYATEFMDASQTIFDCAMDAQDDELAGQILRRMEDYLERYPEEVTIGLRVEDCKYRYARKHGDEHAMLQAMEQKDACYRKVVAAAEKLNIKEIEQYFRINRKLQKAISNETHANRVKTRFLANMSHDIRTPINGIIGMLDIIGASRDDAARVDDCLEKIGASSRLLLSLVNDILDMTKLDSDTVVLENRPFNLDTVCNEVCEVVVCQAEQEGLHVTVEHPDVQDVNLVGSPIHLQKILSNLFSNSIKYNKPGGSIFTRLRELERTEDMATFEFKIWDTGVGMTKEFMENRLFEPFVQEHNVARSKYGGTGLGMSIVGQLVKRMNGTITVESELGKGSSFTVVLPFALDKAAHPAPPEEPVPADIHGKYLLVVEDNALNMEIAEFVLTDAGASVQKAENGKAAVELYQAAPAGTYDAILMDLMMPVMDGYEAARRIRASGKEDAATVPIIAMSANAYAEDVERCLACGMNAHLSKPLFRDVLIATVAKYTSRKR